MQFDYDLPFFLVDFGTPVVANGVSGLGVYDAPARYISDGEMSTTGHMVRCLSSQFGTLLYGQLLTVNGQTYAVRDNLPVGDGKLCVILLSEEAVITTFGALLLEDGGYLLLEDGGRILLEA